MKTSPTIGIIAAALHRAQGTIGAASKDAKNPFFSSSYADLGGVMAVCKEPLLAQGISVLQPIDTREDGSIVLETILLHESGEFIGSSMKISPPKRMVCPKADKEKFEPYLSPDPQAEGAAITYARRYALQALVFIPSVDDDAEWAAAALLNRPLPAETVARVEAKVEALIEKTGEGTEEERQRAHEKAMKLEKNLTKQSPEGIAISEYEAAHPEHKNKVSNARLVDGTWQFDIIESPTNAAKRKAEPAPVVTEPVASVPWQDVKCHIGFQGKASGKLTGLTMAEIFSQNRSPEFVEATIGFFKKNLGVLAAPNAQDKQVWEAAQAAHAAWTEERAKSGTSASETPASTETAPTTTETPQQPAKLQGWGAYIVNSKSLPFNGKKLGDLGGDEVVQLDEYLGKVDWENATLPQKALKANFAMMKADEFPSKLPPAANTEPEHTASLKAMIETHKLNRNSFMSVCKKNGWIDSTAVRIEDITEDECGQIIGEWDEVSTAVRADQP